MIELTARKVAAIGGCLWMSIPVEFVRANHIKPGAKLRVVVDADAKSLVVRLA